jgi:hypothetical protein
MGKTLGRHGERVMDTHLASVVPQPPQEKHFTRIAATAILRQ